MAAKPGQPKTAIEHFNAAAAFYEKSTGGCTRELARILLKLPHLADVGAPGTIVLDNACGTGIVAEEIMQRAYRTQHYNDAAEAAKTATAPIIHVVDPAPNMVEIARGKLEALGETQGRRFTIASHVMPGERLGHFNDDTFTHSITNLGILFYSDGPKGATEIHRTLRAGGIAIVTSWIDLGYLEPIIKPAQLEIRPDEQPYQLPISPEWLSPSFLKSVLVQGGFHDDNIAVSTVKVHFGAATLEELIELLMGTFQVVWKDWSDDEQARFRTLVHEKTIRVAEQYTMPNGEQGVGIPMIASVAVCWK